MIIFLYNLYIFVWIQNSCLPNTVFDFDPKKNYKEVVVCLMTIKSQPFDCGSKQNLLNPCHAE